MSVKFESEERGEEISITGDYCSKSDWKKAIEEKVRSFALREDEAIWKVIDCRHRLQNSPYFCVFKYARAVKQKVWNEAENRERDWGETLKIRAMGV